MRNPIGDPQFHKPELATGKMAWIIDHDWQVGATLIAIMVALMITVVMVIAWHF